MPSRKQVMTLPINQIFTFLTSKKRVLIWLHSTPLRIEGQIVGFDEFMNLTVDGATEVDREGRREEVGRILLKGDAITLMQEVQ